MPRFAVVIAIVLVLTLAAGLAVVPTSLGDPHNNDFTAYWAAGWLNLQGRDPYAAANLLEVERSLGWRPSNPLMLWNPPWILGPLMLAAAVDFTLARNIWLVLQLALSLGSGIALWRYFRGPAQFEWVSLPLMLLFAPLFLSMKYGQIGPLCLVGLTGFLVFERRRNDLLAGAMLSLAAMKPHLVYMVWPAVLMWSVTGGRWKVAVGLVGAGLAFATAPMLTNVGVHGDFLRMTSDPPPPELAGLFITQQDSPTLGWQLRKWFAPGLFSLQYVPTILGMAWLAWYGWRHRRAWDWSQRLPILLLASLCTAAYGAWPADSLLLLPAVMAVSASLARAGSRNLIVIASVVFLGLTLATFAIERQTTTEAYVWVRPAYFLAYVMLMRRTPWEPQSPHS